MVNKIGWNFDGTMVGAQLGEYLMGRYGAKSEKKLAKKLDAGTLAVYAYAKAMSNYFNVTVASELGHQAVKKNKNKSFSVALISALIDAQVYLDSDWGMIYKVVADVLHDGSLHLDMRQEAPQVVMNMGLLCSVKAEVAALNTHIQLLSQFLGHMDPESN